MGTTTAFLAMYLPADNELFDEQLNTNTSFQKTDAGIQTEHNGWTAHAAAPTPHTGHAVFTANTFTGTQTVAVAADANAEVYDVGVLAAAGIQTGERVVYRAHSYDAADHHRDFIWRARTTTNAGNGVLELLTLLDAQAPPTVLQSIDQAGNTTRNGTQTYVVGADIAGVVMDPGPLAAAGTQLGERVVYRAHSFDAVDHYRDFVWRPRTTTNAGAGIFELLTLIDGGGQVVVWSVDQAGNVVGLGGFTGPVATLTGAAGLNFTNAAAVITGVKQVAINQVMVGGNVLQLTGVANTHSVLITGSPVTGQSYGGAINAGTNASDTGFRVGNQGSTFQYFSVRGDGQVAVNPGANAIGNIEAMVVYGANQSPSGYTIHAYGSGSTGQSWGMGVDAGTSSIDNATFVRNRSATTTYWQLRGDGFWTVNGAITLNQLFTTNYAQYVNGLSTTGASYGLQVQAGTNASDSAFYVVNKAGAASFVQMFGNGQVNLGSAALTGAPTLIIYGQAGGQWSEQLYSYNATGHGIQCMAGDGTASYWILQLLNRAATKNVLSAHGNGQVIINESTTLIGAAALVAYSGAEGQWTQMVYGAAVASSSFGIQVYGGYNSSDYGFQVTSRDNSRSMLLVRGDGYISTSNQMNVAITNTSAYYGLSLANYSGASGQDIAYAHPVWSSMNHKVAVQQLGVNDDTPRSAMDLVQAIRGVRYQHHNKIQRRAKINGRWDWTVDHEYVPSVGFVGEEVLPHLPEAVARDDAGNMGLDYGRMVPVLWEAVKELAAEVASLKQQLSGG